MILGRKKVFCEACSTTEIASTELEILRMEKVVKIPRRRKAAASFFKR